MNIIDRFRGWIGDRLRWFGGRIDEFADVIDPPACWEACNDPACPPGPPYHIHFRPYDWKEVDLREDPEARYYVGSSRAGSPRLWGLPR